MMNFMRLRQLVIACETTDSFDQLQQLFDFGAPYHDPGVGEFGLRNAVFSIGDQFLEIIVPTTADAPARRFLDRSGEGGYMVLLQTDDLVATRERLEALSIRRVWDADLPDILATHLHPADIGGAIVSIDEPRPAESWRWGGPDWQKNSVAGKLIGAEFSSSEPDKLAKRWANALGLNVKAGENDAVVALDDADLQYRRGEAERLTSFHVSVPDPDRVVAQANSLGLRVEGAAVHFAGVQFVLS